MSSFFDDSITATVGWLFVFISIVTDSFKIFLLNSANSRERRNEAVVKLLIDNKQVILSKTQFQYLQGCSWVLWWLLQYTSSLDGLQIPMIKEKTLEYIRILCNFKTTLYCSWIGTNNGNNTVLTADCDVFAICSPTYTTNTCSMNEICWLQLLMTFERFECNHLITIDNRDKSVCWSCNNIAMFSIYVNCCAFTHMTIHLLITSFLFSNISFVLKRPGFFVIDNHIHTSHSIYNWQPRFRETSFRCYK